MILPKIHVEKNGSAIKPIKVANFVIQLLCDGYIRENIINPIKQIM